MVFVPVGFFFFFVFRYAQDLQSLLGPSSPLLSPLCKTLTGSTLLQSHSVLTNIFQILAIFSLKIKTYDLVKLIQYFIFAFFKLPGMYLS